MAINFKRVAAAFEYEVSRRRGGRPCGSDSSSGSEYSPEIDSGGTRDLSHLVNSFIERGDHWVGSADEDGVHENVARKNQSRNEEREDEKHEERKQVLLKLLGGEDDDDDGVKESLKVEVETGWRLVGGDGGVEFKRRLMGYSRDRGYDAGLCKSRWSKTSEYPAGDYDYIDIISDNTRYIINLNLSNEFQIARPTPHYNHLLATLPRILISKPETLKQIIRLMNDAVKESLKKANMFVPPWRKNGYMMSKWFGRYKRTTNVVVKDVGEGGEGLMRRSVGFKEPEIMDQYYYCRDEVAAVFGFRTGLLTAAFRGM